MKTAASSTANERRGMLCQMERMWKSLLAGVDPVSARSTSL